MATTEKSKVISAIDKLGRKVTAADVATQTGLPILVATQELNRVASETGGHLMVAETGAVAYQFPAAFQTAYLTKGIAKVCHDLGDAALKTFLYILRISFGIMLVLSFLVVIGLVIAVMISGRGGNDRDRDRGGSFHFGFFDWLILRDLFSWGAYSTGRYYPTETWDNRRQARRKQSNFLLDCFSFLFGDGDPNIDLEEKRWRYIAQNIRQNNGIAVSEQLAPYTGKDPRFEDNALPVLVRFNGQPEVTDTGNIVYVFPSIQEVASSNQYSELPPYLQERRWKFAENSIDSMVPVILLAAANFFGSWWLYFKVPTEPVLMAFAPLITTLVIYGTAFILVPLIRWGIFEWKNIAIDNRNKLYRRYADSLKHPNSELVTKLAQTKDYKVKEHRISQDEIVYTTEKDVLDQPIGDDWPLK